MLPSLQRLLRILDQDLPNRVILSVTNSPPTEREREGGLYLQRSRIRRVTVCLKHVTDIESCDPVHGPAVSPTEGRFQAAAVERTDEGTLVIASIVRNGAINSPD